MVLRTLVILFVAAFIIWAVLRRYAPFEIKMTNKDPEWESRKHEI